MCPVSAALGIRATVHCCTIGIGPSSLGLVAPKSESQDGSNPLLTIVSITRHIYAGYI